MGLRTWLGLKPSHKKALESAFDPVDFSVNPRIPAGFREFTLPPRLQRGGRFPARDGRKPAAMRVPIVPVVGVKVP